MTNKRLTIEEELKRYKTINKYINVLNEQAVPAPEDPNAVPPAPAAAPPAPEAAPTGDVPPSPETAPESNTPDGGEVPPPPGGEDGVDTETNPTDDDTTEEIDITDLVNMTKSIKQELENSKGDNSGVIQKMDDVFTKLNDLESKLGEMDNIINKIDELGSEVSKMKTPTPVEKLEMRSIDSYPFNEKPKEFFDEKQEEMRNSGKNEYILTKDDVDNYAKNQIMKSFNPKEQDQEFNAKTY